MVRENMRSLDTVRFALLPRKMYGGNLYWGPAQRCSGSFVNWITVCRFRPRIPLVLSFILVFCCFDLWIYDVVSYKYPIVSYDLKTVVICSVGYYLYRRICVSSNPGLLLAWWSYCMDRPVTFCCSMRKSAVDG